MDTCPTCGQEVDREAIEREVEAVQREMEAADARIIENADGTLIVRLEVPVRVGGADHERLTIGRVRVRHLRAARGAEHVLEAYAEQLISPAGALDELASERDYYAVLRATDRALGKFREGGRPSSPS